MLPRALALFAVVALAGCSTVPQGEEAAALLRGKDLDSAEKLLVAAQPAQNVDQAVVFRARAAEIAWTKSANGGSVKSLASLSDEKQRSLRVLNEATGALSTVLIKDSGEAHAYTFAGYSYRLESAPATRHGAHRATEFVGAVTADRVPKKLCRDWCKEPGAGAPLAVQWRMPTDPPHERFNPKLGWASPITAVLNFGPEVKSGSPRVARIAYLDPEDISRASVGNAEYPLAADFTAPIVERYRGVKEASLALSGLLSSDSKDARLGLLEPYDRDRIPVVFVHGLYSHPLMWRNVINELRADKELRGRYQYLAFYYPTGWPPAYSAMRLREELAAFDKTYGRQQQMVLIGHSMGGILSRLQVISPERAIWNAQLGAKADEAYKTLPADHLGRRTFLFAANPDITREIYICVPHRGAKMADWSLVTWFTKFIKMPSNILKAAADVPGTITERRQLSSINRLSPANPLYPAMDKIPIQVPYHSIIGDRGRNDSPNSSDGVVSYWSSHLTGAKSELIVPGPHGSYELPQAIAEVKRILLLHYKASHGRSTAAEEPEPVREIDAQN